MSYLTLNDCKIFSDKTYRVSELSIKLGMHLLECYQAIYKIERNREAKVIWGIVDGEDTVRIRPL